MPAHRDEGKTLVAAIAAALHGLCQRCGGSILDPDPFTEQMAAVSSGRKAPI
jgi:hypothetical protein